MENKPRFAVLIDAENVSAKYIKIIFEELAKHGSVTYKRIYSDWTHTTSNAWKNELLEYSLLPVQQFRYTVGKNSSDSAMIIDAMDILYTGQVDGFCLVTSDSDFTRLAVRLREAGKTVIGMGERKTPKSFVAACHGFSFLDDIEERNAAEKARKAAEKAKAEAEARAEELAKAKAAAEAEAKRQAGFLGIRGKLRKLKEKLSGKKGKERNAEKKSEPPAAPEPPPAVKTVKVEIKPPTKKKKKKKRKKQPQPVAVESTQAIESTLVAIVRDHAGADGWILLAHISTYLCKEINNFNSKRYGYAKLSTMLMAMEQFEVRAERAVNGIDYYVRLKKT